MAPRKEIKYEDRLAIVSLHQQGLSGRAIARQVSVSHNGVQTTLSRYRQTGSCVNKRGRGRKRKTSRQQDRQIVRRCVADRWQTSTQLAAQFNATAAVCISKETVKRRLREAGMMWTAAGGDKGAATTRALQKRRGVAREEADRKSRPSDTPRRQRTDTKTHKLTGVKRRGGGCDCGD